jgi:hypothetical protein
MSNIRNPDKNTGTNECFYSKTIQYADPIENEGDIKDTFILKTHNTGTVYNKGGKENLYRIL